MCKFFSLPICERNYCLLEVDFPTQRLTPPCLRSYRSSIRHHARLDTTTSRRLLYFSLNLWMFLTSQENVILIFFETAADLTDPLSEKLPGEIHSL